MTPILAILLVVCHSAYSSPGFAYYTHSTSPKYYSAPFTHQQHHYQHPNHLAAPQFYYQPQTPFYHHHFQPQPQFHAVAPFNSFFYHTSTPLQGRAAVPRKMNDAADAPEAPTPTAAAPAIPPPQTQFLFPDFPQFRSAAFDAEVHRTDAGAVVYSSMHGDGARSTVYMGFGPDVVKEFRNYNLVPIDVRFGKPAADAASKGSDSDTAVIFTRSGPATTDDDEDDSAARTTRQQTLPPSAQDTTLALTTISSTTPEATTSEAPSTTTTSTTSEPSSTESQETTTSPSATTTESA